MHERIVGLYEENAAAWDRQRDRGLIEKAWLDRFLAELGEHPSVLDLGCGMGEPIARYLIQRGVGVLGLDSAPSLVAICRDRFPDHEWRVGDMRTLSLGRTFNGLIAWHSFFHLSREDQRQMFARFAGHVRPGGQLLFTSGDSHGEAIGCWQGDALYHASLDPDEYRRLLRDHGFSVVGHRLRDPECGGATVWLARRD